MKKKSQHSHILDFIINNLPSVDIHKTKPKSHIDPKSAKTLYSIWRDNRNQISGKIYKRPVTLSSSDVEDMMQQGLVRCVGNNVEITSKGSSIIETMILGNDKSSFEDEDIDYLTAKKNVNARNKDYEDSWWERFV